jgi:hypothetical protein
MQHLDVICMQHLEVLAVKAVVLHIERVAASTHNLIGCYSLG